jgi:penicillin amidase
VAGGEDVVHRLAFTRHGPVVHVDLVGRKAAAVRAVWLEPGMVPYLASLEYQDAADATAFRTALRRWGAPAVNQVFATVDGDIGWQASGMLPLRPGWDGSVPVPGDGRYEWDGFAEVEALPSVLNPQSGWFSSSNENNVPADFHADPETPLTATTDWYSAARHERLVDWLGSAAPHDVASSAQMQRNADNVHGRHLLDSLAGVTVPADVDEEWTLLQEWDGIESVDSRAALVFQVWQRRHLRPWLVDTCLARLGASPEQAAAARHRLLRADTLFSDLRPDQRMIDTFDLADEADRTLLGSGVGATLVAALAEVAELVEGAPADWTWGALHRTVLRHPVLSTAVDVPTEWGELAAVPRAGSGDTVGLTGYDATFNAVMGSSFRIAVDVGEWDNTLVVNSPGQSGDPRSPHYADLLAAWGADETFPLVYSRAAVEAAAVRRTVLSAAATDQNETDA